jgi:hypothetical protein
MLGYPAVEKEMPWNNGRFKKTRHRISK